MATGYNTPIGGEEPGYFQRFHSLLNQKLGWLAGGDNEHINAMREARNKAAKLENELSRIWMEKENDRREAELFVIKHDEGLRAHLKYLTRGKKMDKNYETYCTRLAEAYFEKVKISDPRKKNEVMEATMKLHIRDRLSTEPLLMQNSNMLGRANYLNTLMDGRKISYPWWNLWRPYTEVLTDGSENEQSPYFVPERPNFWKYVAITSGLVITGLTVKYVISRACSSHTTGIITQSAVKQLEQLSKLDILPSSLKNTEVTQSKDCTDTLSLMSHILEYGPLKSTLTACGQQVRSCFTWVPTISITWTEQ